MEDCIFCGIASGGIPSKKVYEDNDFLAFLDIAPIIKGHTLVIPKKHSKNLLETDQETEDKLFHVVNKVARAVITATSADGVNITTNVGKAAGQAVFHTHIHIIPRFENDSLVSWPGTKYDNDEEQDKYAGRIMGVLAHRNS